MWSTLQVQSLNQQKYTSGGKVALSNGNSNVQIVQGLPRNAEKISTVIEAEVLQELDHSYCKGVGHQK